MTTAQYEISWTGYPGDPAPQVVDYNYFREMGFEASDLVEIEALQIHEEFVSGGPFDSICVVRLK